MVTDQSTSTQKAVGTVSDYTGSTKTVTLSADPGVFTMAVGDTIEIIAALGSAGSAPTAAAIADAVWDESTSGHTTAGTFGEQVKTDIDAILVDTGTTLDGKIDTIDGIVDSILVDTAEIGAAGAGLTEAGGTGDHLTGVPWNSTWDAEVQSECTDALNAYDPPTNTEMEARTLAAASYATASKQTDIETDTQDIQSRLPAALVGGRIDATVDATGMESGAVDAILTRQMTESYAANGTAPTLAQAMFAIHQSLMDFDISSTSLTVRQLDSSTAAFIVTLNDASSPTGAERT